MSALTVDKLQVLVTANTKQMQASFAKVEAELNGLKNKTSKVSGELKDAVKGFARVSTAALGVAGVAAVKLAGDYQKSLNIFQSVSGATAKQMDLVGEKAKALGNDIALPGVSASSAAEAMTELAKAGLSVNDIMASSKSVLSLSIAGQLGVADAANITAGAMKAFGLKGKDAIKVADELAAAANASLGDVSDFALALKQASSSAAQLNIPMSDTVTVLAQLANNGISASDAGTSLKTFLQRLTPQTKEAADAMKELGLDFFNSQGQFVGMQDVVKQLQDKLGGLTQEQKQQALTTLFGADASRAASVILKGGVKQFDKMRQSVTKTGAAQDLAAAQTKGFNGAMENFLSTVETVGINVGKVLLPPLTQFFNFIAAHITTFAIIGATIATFGVILGSILGVMKVVRLSMEAWTAITKIATAVQAAFNLVLSLNPITLVIIAVAALVAGLIYFFTQTKIGQKIIKAAFDAIKNVIMAVWNWVKDHWPLLLAILTGPIGLAVLAIVKNLDKIKAAFKAAWEFIKRVWSAAPGFFRGVWHGITSALSSVKSWFGNLFSGAWHMVERAFSGVSSFFGGVKSRIVGAFSGIGHSISSFFHNIWGSVGEDLKSAINAVLHLPLTIPKIHIPHVGTIGGQTLIPRLAKGGIIDSATLALVGESGKEAVMPLENNTGWIDELAGKLNSKGNGGQHLTIKIGEDTILDRVIGGINDRSFLNGSSVLNI